MLFCRKNPGLCCGAKGVKHDNKPGDGDGDKDGGTKIDTVRRKRNIMEGVDSDDKDGDGDGDGDGDRDGDGDGDGQRDLLNQ